MTADIDKLADSLTHEPNVFMDCTAKELGIASIIGAASGVVVTTLVTIIFSSFMVGFVAGLIIFMIASFGVVSFIQTMKGRYYETWLDEKIFLFKVSLGLGSSRFVNHSARYSRGARRG